MEPAFHRFKLFSQILGGVADAVEAFGVQFVNHGLPPLLLDGFRDGLGEQEDPLDELADVFQCVHWAGQEFKRDWFSAGWFLVFACETAAAKWIFHAEPHSIPRWALALRCSFRLRIWTTRPAQGAAAGRRGSSRPANGSWSPRKPPPERRWRIECGWA
jgi:diadenosine tetraphosphate (Ap4A) HIT family hydrolase